MKKITKRHLMLLALLPSVACGLCLVSCEVEKVEEGRAPDIDIDADPGKLPKYDVDAPDVEVGTKKVEVDVPTIDVIPPDEDGDDPDDTPPADGEKDR
jgi:hypothetical protein